MRKPAWFAMIAAGLAVTILVTRLATAADDGKPIPRVDQRGDPLPEFALARIGSGRYFHGGEFSLVAMSPDGKLVASAGGRTEREAVLLAAFRDIGPPEPIRLFEAHSGRLLRLLDGTSARTVAIDFSADGSRLASADGIMLRIWDTTTGKQLQGWVAHADVGGAKSLALSPDGRTVVSRGASGALIHWHCGFGVRLREIRKADEPLEHFAFSRDGKFLALATGADVRLWDLDAGKEARKIDTASGSFVTFAPDDKRVAVVQPVGVGVYDVESGRELDRFPAEEVTLERCWFGDGGNMVAQTAGARIDEESTVLVYDRTIKKPVLDLTDWDMRAVSVSGDGKFIAAAQRNRVGVWNANSGVSLLPRHGADGIGYTFGLSADGRILITHDGREIQLRHPRSGQVYQSTDAQVSGIFGATVASGVAVSCDGRFFATQVGSRGGDEIGIWETASAKLIRRGLRAQQPDSILFNHDASQIAAASRAAVMTWDTRTGQQTRLFAPPNVIRHCRLSSDARLAAAVVRGDDKVVVYDIETGQRVFEQEVGVRRARGVRLAQDGKHLLVQDRTLAHVFDVEMGTLVHQLNLGIEATDPELSPDGKLMGAMTDEGLVGWNLATGAEVFQLASEATRFEFVADNKTLVSREKDGTLIIWDLEAARAIHRPISRRHAAVEPPGRESTQLHQAAYYGRVDDIEKLTAAGENTEATDSTGRTPLHLAAAEGHAEVVTALLQAGAKVAATGEFGDQTPLHMACMFGHAEAATLLVKAGARLDAADADDRLPLHAAATSGWPGVVSALLKSGADVDSRTRRGWTPLHFACADGQLEMATLLLDQSADVDAVTKAGDTPLMLVVATGNEDAAKLLLEHGAEIDAANRAGKSVLTVAASAGKRAMVRWLLKQGATLPSHLGNPPLNEIARRDLDRVADRLLRLADVDRRLGAAIAAGDVEQLTAFFDLWPELNGKRTKGVSLLGRAAATGNSEVVKLMMERGANPSFRTEYGEERGRNQGTALHAAVFSGDVATVKAILDAGVELAFDRPGMKSVFDAYVKSDRKPEMLDLLLDRSVHLAPTNSDQTPLHAAVEANDIKLARRLLDSGADPNAGPPGSPLQTAVYEGHLELVKLMIAHGGNVKLPGPRGATLMQIAAIRKKREVVQFLATAKMLPIDIHSAAAINDLATMSALLKADARLAGARMPDGRTPLHIAAAADHAAACQLLLDHKADINARSLRTETPLNAADNKRIETLLASHGAVATPDHERLRVGAGAKIVRAMSFIGRFAMFPGGAHHLCNDSVYSLVSNIGGVRVAEFEIEEPSRRISAIEIRDKPPKIVVVDWPDGRRRRRMYDSWKEVEADDPAAFAQYARHRTDIQAQTLDGYQVLHGGGGEGGGHIPWPAIGVNIKDVEAGCEVTGLVPGTDAEGAGIQIGDVITKIEGHDVPNLAGLRNLLARYAIGEQVKVQVKRAGIIVTKEVALSRR